MEKELKIEEKGMSDDLAALTKKSKFLEKQYQEANSQLRDIVCALDITLFAGWLADSFAVVSEQRTKVLTSFTSKHLHLLSTSRLARCIFVSTRRGSSYVLGTPTHGASAVLHQSRLGG